MRYIAKKSKDKYTVTGIKEMETLDNTYMEKHTCYIRSVTTTLLKVALVNNYPSSIGYHIYYTVIGK